jgi:hypothetical protein
LAATEDAFLTNYAPGEFVAAKSAVLDNATAIAIRGWGTDTEGDTASVRFSFWMGTMEDPEGPGQVGWSGTVELGALTFTGRPASITNAAVYGQWVDAAWLEIDTYSAAGSYFNHGYAQGGGHSTLVLPTVGYTMCMCEVADKDGTGTEISTIGFVWRPTSWDGII